ncbi:hypothetical protein [Paludisphaera mucosa]|uniref:Transmembrane protein n=1 Tax=Paludisphaera mucosa TaxID=3030827 RepID=A0ABT6F7L6_9BACT|nr:hypothetical protein [Paludisphaera mucosa]MDG3003385.1 hypothetical protein [Paludisphaera mucosa]
MSVDVSHSRHFGLIAAAASILLPGCLAAQLFEGRLLIVNTSGGPLKSLRLFHGPPGIDQSIALNDMDEADVQILDCRVGRHALSDTGIFKLSFIDRSGVDQIRPIPLAEEIAGHSDDDFVVEVESSNGVLLRRVASQEPWTVWYKEVGSFAAAVGVGMLLGRFAWPRRRSGREPRCEIRSATFHP